MYAHNIALLKKVGKANITKTTWFDDDYIRNNEASMDLLEAIGRVPKLLNAAITISGKPRYKKQAKAQSRGGAEYWQIQTEHFFAEVEAVWNGLELDRKHTRLRWVSPNDSVAREALYDWLVNEFGRYVDNTIWIDEEC